MGVMPPTKCIPAMLPLNVVVSSAGCGEARRLGSQMRMIDFAEWLEEEEKSAGLRIRSYQVHDKKINLWRV